ncbi:hypothetical protein BV898_07906 [Hypsibius exemplaris]|uniref:Uncharacterized protein n=1 Tax=Hypsibius exemplaris TaxID=2072580 RepID=A0A1W0WS40_HYPEX|nr:hypothetical protein BV898_07906 [Hypsibius exemplaris]
MAVSSPANCCMRFLRFVVWNKGNHLLQFVFCFILSGALIGAGLALEQNGLLGQRWAMFSFDAAAAALLIKSAVSLGRALWPFCYREVGCLRKCLRRCCCSGVEFYIPPDLRNAQEEQLSHHVLRLLGQLPQVEHISDPAEVLPVRDRLRFRRPTDNVYCLTKIKNEDSNPDLETGTATPLLNANFTDIAYTTPRDVVPSYHYPETAERIRKNVSLNTRRYWMAASATECLRCFFFIRNALDHYLIDELENVYKVKDIWLPPIPELNGMLFYGELTVDTENKSAAPKLAFYIIAELPDDDHPGPAVLDKLMKEKKKQVHETNYHKINLYYGKKEPFALRSKFGAEDKTIYETTRVNADKLLKPLQIHDPLFGCGLVFVQAPPTDEVQGRSSPEYCTFLPQDNKSVYLIKNKLFPPFERNR